jgi:S-ribosylhomocysteine lyase
MKKIQSFCVDHDLLVPGLYRSRVDGDVVTYDIRTRVPNGGDYMSPPLMHTVEHLMATYVRNSAHGEEVIYFGPMGCRTGFYLLLRDSVSAEEAIALVKASFAFVADFRGRIPGSERRECGNYLEHDLEAARAEAVRMLRVLDGWSPERLIYLT